MKRWQAISESAAKQSKRLLIPEVKEPVKFSEALKLASDLDVRLIPYELAEGMDGTRRIIQSVKPGQLWLFLSARKAVLKKRRWNWQKTPVFKGDYSWKTYFKNRNSRNDGSFYSDVSAEEN